MLAVIAVIGILAALLLPGLAGSKRKAQQVVCLNDLKQVALAFHLYHGDYQELFPAPGSRWTYGQQPEDWIWWEYGRELNKSSIVPYLGKFTPSLYTCPLDNRARSLQTKGYLPDEPYRYSYALTSYTLFHGINPGMSTIITKSRQVFPFRISSVKAPSSKIMLLEEDDSTIDDSRWAPSGIYRGVFKLNLVSTRHQGKGCVSFADGHVMAVEREFGQNPLNSSPILND
jgi:prepilin-type processing-associated H-X9-DG protein